MKKVKNLLGLIAIFAILIGCETKEKVDITVDINENSGVLRADVEDRISFPDFGFMLSPEDYHGRVFRLSDTYPTKEPKIDEGVEKILAIDFKTDWKKYMYEVRKYVYEGNASTDYQNSFFLEDNKVRSWYHVPWQHWGPQGREGFHGLTQEGPVPQQSLATEQTFGNSHAYAVGFYNAQGGYGIGRVWNEEEPNYSSFLTEGFPEGTVVAKVLFVPLESDEVPYLEDPIAWDAYIYQSDVPNAPTPKNSSDRVQHKVNLIQMDIMVKDKRAESTGGWVFGTFVYNGKLGNDNKWENMMPVGIMWGNDPNDNETNYNPKPTKTIINTKLKETIINDDPAMPAMHLGFNSRLNGPVDNQYSSCMSCHSTAQYPVVTGILPQFNKPDPVKIPALGTKAPADWMNWFRNIECGTPFNPGQAVSMDYSLQLSKSIENYIEYASGIKQGQFYEEYWSDDKIRRNMIVLK